MARKLRMVTPPPVPKDLLEEIVADSLDFSGRKILKGNQTDPQISVTTPANGLGSANALESLVKASFANNLGTHRPNRVLIGVHPHRTYLFLMPVDETVSGDVLEVTYGSSNFRVNLYNPFAVLNRHVPTGYREIYDCVLTPKAITIGEQKGFALALKLGKPQKLPIDSEEMDKAAAPDGETEG